MISVSTEYLLDVAFFSKGRPNSVELFACVGWVEFGEFLVNCIPKTYNYVGII